MEKEYMTVKQLAEYVQMSPGTIYRLTSQHAIPCVRVGAAIRYEKTAIDKWLEEQNNERV